MGYKDKTGNLFRKGRQVMNIAPTLTMQDSDDIMTQNLGKPVKNTTGAQ